MLRALRTIVAGAAALAVITACTPAVVVESPDLAAVPTGEPVAQGGEATGPITVLGSGQAFDLGWRYAMYESAEGLCTQLEMGGLTTAGCGDPLPADGEHIGGVSVGKPVGQGVTPVDGIVSDDAVTVWIIDQQVGRIPATLMPLDDAGLEGQAFVGFMPPDGTPTHVQAVALSGEVIATYELP